MIWVGEGLYAHVDDIMRIETARPLPVVPVVPVVQWWQLQQQPSAMSQVILTLSDGHKVMWDFTSYEDAAAYAHEIFERINAWVPDPPDPGAEADASDNVVSLNGHAA